VPGDKLDWKPHPKSMTLGYLAALVADLPGWTVSTLTQDSLDLGAYRIDVPGGRDQLLETFDAHVARARDVIARTSDDEFARPWTLLVNGVAALTLPKHVVLRSFVFNHLVHHRAQLGVFLRLLDIPVPAIYGPSADEAPL
jgi:hypothetical protein